MTTRRPIAGLLAASAVSMAGTRMSLLALPWFVLVTTGSAGRIGVVAFAEMLPYVAVGAAGGPLLDRFGARRVSVTADVSAGATVMLVPLLHSAGWLSFPLLCALVALLGVQRGFGDSAKRILLPGTADIGGVPLERAAGLFDGVSRLATLLGAPLGGVLIAAASAEAALAVNGATFLLGAAVIGLSVPAAAGVTREPATAEADSASYGARLREGLAWLGRDRLFLGIAVMLFVTNLMDQAYATVLLPVWVREGPGTAVALGAIVGVFAAGAVLGNAVTTWLGPRLPRRATFAICFLLCGSPRFFVLAISPAVPVVLAVAFAAGLGAGAINPILGAVQFERIPRALQARVLGAMGALAFAGIPLGGLLAGAAVGGLGLVGALVLAGGLYLAATLVPFFAPSWRGLDRGAPRSGTPSPHRASEAELGATGP